MDVPSRSTYRCEWKTYRCDGPPAASPRAPAGAPAVPVRIVWLFWAQGWALAPPIVKACARSWRRHNPRWEVRRISLSNVSTLGVSPLHARYAHVPLNNTSQYSDIVRTELLRRFGGLWADATLYCAQPIESWMPLTLPFFALKMNRTNLRDSARSFLLYASGPPQAGGLLLQLQSAGMRQFWQQPRFSVGRVANNDAFGCHFYWHHIWSCLARTYAPFAKAYHALPELPAVDQAAVYPQTHRLFRSNHVAMMTDEMRQRFDAGPIFKLTYKTSAAQERKGSVIDYFVSSI